MELHNQLTPQNGDSIYPQSSTFKVRVSVCSVVNSVSFVFKVSWCYGAMKMLPVCWFFAQVPKDHKYHWHCHWNELNYCIYESFSQHFLEGGNLIPHKNAMPKKSGFLRSRNLALPAPTCPQGFQNPPNPVVCSPCKFLKCTTQSS